ncbi:MAG: pyruvate dehydrogenase, partial [Pseudobdellovibrionaceae bacterium]
MKIENERSTLESIARRAHYLATQMIFQANNRNDKDKGDPKIGGHVSASASALHILGALHLIVKSGFDHIANKPHASPADHSYNYLLDLFLKADHSKFSLEEANTAMMGLRKFSQNGEPVFQSYHSVFDPDHHNFFPSGTVGIPPVNAGYMALAYRFAREHGYEAPQAHFWAVSGDSEFREGSMYEAIPDFAERELGNLTWIVDYNRQSLDGHRITNKKIMQGTDAQRIERTMLANGWDVINLQHGSLREALFKKSGGDTFRRFLEEELEDYEFQALLLVQDMKALKKGIAKERPSMKKFLESVSDEELYLGLRDLGGHDMILLAKAMLDSKKNPRKPTMIIAHTVKGWNLKMAAAPGNHSALLTAEEMDELRKAQGIKGDTLFARFEDGSAEAKYLKKRGEELYGQIKEQNSLKARNIKKFSEEIQSRGGIPNTLDISTKMASYPHTQWMLGQLTAKLTRIANTSLNEKELKPGQKALAGSELSWKTPAELLVTMAPDVGTSTNLNPAMDGKIFGAPVVPDFEQDHGVK